jgi:hypothetical protein
MKPAETYRWLMENGGPVIRYRTATELMPPDKSLNIQALQNDLLQSKIVQTWLGHFRPPVLLNLKPTRQGEFTRGSIELHGAKDTALENVLGKLTDFGLKRGMPELDNLVVPYLEWLNVTSKTYPQYLFVIWMRLEVADFLARSGYLDEPEVLKLIKAHLDVVYQFARKGDHNIYVDPKSYKKMPANFSRHPLINPKLTRGEIKLPMVYDILGWGPYLKKAGAEDRKKADVVIDFIFNVEYQAYPWGYGVMLDEDSGHFWAMGWSLHIPGFTKSIGGDLEKQLRIIRLEQLVHFKAARRHPWFKAGLEHLEQFRTPDGTYLFPRQYLPEKPAAYWVVGGKYALEESPRNRKAIEAESTFWMAKIQKILTASAG